MPAESADDLASMFDSAEFAGGVVWTVGGNDHALSVFEQANTFGMSGDGEVADVLVREATIVMPEAAIPAGGAAGDAVTFRNTPHIVKSIEPDGTGVVVVRLEEVI